MTIPKELLDELHERIRLEVAMGFDGRDEIVESAIASVFPDDESEPVMPDAAGFVDAALLAHRMSQDAWPRETDCDRLDRAFAALDARGIVARQHFTCCGTCGAGEIFEIAEERKMSGEPIRGYTFYHWQDTEGAVESGDLYLSYGSVEDGEAAALAVGKEVAEELRRYGLATSWNGRWDKRIGLKLDWKRRR
jgi:hypothetical protein